jgi:hypothetical protein
LLKGTVEFPASFWFHTHEHTYKEWGNNSRCDFVETIVLQISGSTNR